MAVHHWSVYVVAAWLVCGTQALCTDNPFSLKLDCSDENRSEVPLPNITSSVLELDMSRNVMRVLQNHSFYGLSSLTKLWIRQNLLVEIAPDAFVGLTNLQTLDLSANQLKTTASGAFTDLTNLQTLDLSANQLKTNTPDAFTGLTNLQSLSLSANQLTTTASFAFTGLTNLQTLDLSANQLTTNTSGAFAGLTNLQSLTLSANQLTTTASGAFAGLTNLQTLDLTANQLTTTAPGTFAGLTNLQSLDLSANQLTQWPDLSGTCASLTSLILYDNQLEQANNHLQCLTALETLGVNGNGLTRFPNVSEVGATIETFYLYSNSLEVVTQEDILSLTSIKLLDLSSNLLTECGVFDVLTTLETLKLKQNAIPTIDDCLVKFPEEGEKLDLAFNSMPHIPSFGPYCATVKTLYMAYCLVTTVADDAFDDCHNVTNLGLDNNNLTEFPPLAGMNESLTDITLHNNAIAEIVPERIQELVKLKYLNLGNNRLSAFPNVPGPSGSLERLSLSQNAFSTFPNLSIIGVKLQQLYLSQNQIVSFSQEDVSVLPNLRTLWLSLNLITAVPILQSLPEHLASIDLNENPVSSLPRQTLVNMASHGWGLSLFRSQLTSLPSPCGALRGGLDIRSIGTGIDFCSCDNLWLKLIQSQLKVSQIQCSGLSWTEASLQDLMAVCTQPDVQPYKVSRVRRLSWMSGCGLPTSGTILDSVTRTHCVVRCLEMAGCGGINFRSTGSKKGQCWLLAPEPATSDPPPDLDGWTFYPISI